MPAGSGKPRLLWGGSFKGALVVFENMGTKNAWKRLGVQVKGGGEIVVLGSEKGLMAWIPLSIVMSEMD